MIALAAALWMQAAAGPAASTSFEVLSQKAIEARNARRTDEALVLFKQALSIRPDWIDGLWEAGSIEYDQNKYQECAADFLRLASKRPDQAPPWTMAGLCLYHLRDYEKAFKSLHQAQRLQFKEPAELGRSARLHLALVLIKLHSYEKAITELVNLTRDDKKSPEIIVAAGIAGLRQAWTPPEVPEPERQKVYELGDAMAAVMEQAPKEASKKFAIVLQNYPNDANVHFRYGAFLMQEDPDRGIQEIRRGVELDPHLVPALTSLATIYLKRSDPATARQFASKAVEASPDDFATHVVLGRVMLDMDEPAAAIRELQKAVQLAPESPEAHFSLASAYAKLGRGKDAARERQEFLRLRKLAGPEEP